MARFLQVRKEIGHSCKFYVRLWTGNEAPLRLTAARLI